ncbi:HAMP domain-containing sensor histidine kinase [Pricia sp. S334]|uniref:histidine kinase n=1 Tax=Pricia mediterranea TaxID=3076079 RepID=A0ABU3L2T3_9FLAO|nr:HAMP domain-containing sensor histidine kinase [Pricia sp. S334]MDT7827499.1 HAMP domain-containing sensor histidine kinase [Pricia sp. S334]
MKLLNYTTTYFALLSVLLISVWAIIFYFAMLDEVYDSLDDGLENQKMLIIQEARKDSSLLETKNFGIGSFTIQKTSSKSHGQFKDRYLDTLVYMQNENDYEPVRILESVFEQDGAYYKIKLMTSMVEEDDQIENLIYYLIGLYLLLVISIVVLNNLVLKRVWSPFYALIEKLRDFRIERDGPITPEPTSIVEFALLNKSVERLTETSRQTYKAQKQFIENAAHELQTPLAVGINKLELLLEKGELNQEQSQEMAEVLETLGRLTRLNRSLLLLSKIDNRQHIDRESIDLNGLAERIVADFSDFAAHRNIELNLRPMSGLQFRMNPDLASVLLTNLIKNAIVHGTGDSPVEVVIAFDRIIVSNYAVGSELDSGLLFTRFHKTSTDHRSTGLGLSISKAIADRYGVQLQYKYSDRRHVFELVFPKA